MEDNHLCCCCLELVALKGLWTEYTWMGSTEVYGDMLETCFNLKWDNKDEMEYLICEVCITRLRNAVHFKRNVIQSQSTLRLQLVDVMQPLKQEILDVEDPKKEFEVPESDIYMKSENEGNYDQADDFFNDNDYEINRNGNLRAYRASAGNGF